MERLQGLASDRPNNTGTPCLPLSFSGLPARFWRFSSCSQRPSYPFRANLPLATLLNLLPW